MSRATLLSSRLTPGSHTSSPPGSPTSSVSVTTSLSPPSSTSAPDEHPSIASIIKAIHAIKNGTYLEDDNFCFHLPPTEIDNLHSRIYADPEIAGFFGDKIRLNYCSAQEELELYMGSVLHDTFAGELARLILAELDRIGVDHPDAFPYIQKIDQPVTSKIRLGSTGTFDRRHPDWSFGITAPFPSVVLEVSYTQKPKKLDPIARNYLRRSNGNIRVVIGFNLQYKPKDMSVRASVLLWRVKTKFVEGELKRIPALLSNDDFRDKDGNCCDGSLNLTLADFVFNAPPSIGKLPVSLPYLELCTCLSKAEAHMEVSKKQTDIITADEATTWDTTENVDEAKLSPELDTETELSPSRESDFQRLEEQDECRSTAVDETFCGRLGKPVQGSRRASDRLAQQQKAANRDD